MISLAKISTFILGAVFLAGMLLQFVRIQSTKAINKKIGFVFVVGMMLIAYSTWLGEGSDLARYYNILSQMKGKSLAWAMENSVYKNTVIVNAFMWMIAQTGINQLLPALSTGIILVNMIYFIHLENQRDTLELSTQLTYWMVYFAIATFSAIMTGVRQNWMISLFAIAVHRDVIQKKRGILTIIMYAMACLIHNSALLLVSVRLASLTRGWIRYVFLGWSLLIPYAERFTQLEGIFGEAAERLDYYQGVEGIDIRLLIAKTAVLAMVFVVLCLTKNKEKKNSYYGFMEMLVIFTASAVGVQHVYSRLINAVTVCCLPLLADFKRRTRNTIWVLLVISLLVVCLGLFSYQLTAISNYWEFR